MVKVPDDADLVLEDMTTVHSVSFTNLGAAEPDVHTFNSLNHTEASTHFISSSIMQGGAIPRFDSIHSLHDSPAAEGSNVAIFCIGLIAGVITVFIVAFTFCKALLTNTSTCGGEAKHASENSMTKWTRSLPPRRRSKTLKSTRPTRLSRAQPRTGEPPGTSGPDESETTGHECLQQNTQALPESIKPTFKGIRFTEEFQVACTEGVIKRFRWMTLGEASAAGLPHAKAPVLEEDHCAKDQAPVNNTLRPVHAPWSVESLRLTLINHGIELKAWDDHKLRTLASELVAGKTFLVLSQKGELRRTAEVLTVVVQPASGSDQVITCEDASLADCAEYMDTSEPVPSIWFSPTTESIANAAQRCLQIKLGLPEDAVKLRWGKVKSFMEEHTFPFYPGLTTVMRRMLVQGTMQGDSEEAMSDLSPLEKLKRSVDAVDAVGYLSRLTGSCRYPDTGEARGRLTWTWKNWSQVPSLARTRLRKSMMLFKDDFYHVSLPWTETEVRDLLESHGAQPEVDFDMTLEELSLKASQGELSFGVTHGKLLCVQDVVHLRLVNSECSAVLVEIDKEDKLKWPSIQQELGECGWDAAFRTGSTCVGLERACFRIGFEALEVPHSQDDSRFCIRSLVFTAHIPGKKKRQCEVIHCHKL